MHSNPIFLMKKALLLLLFSLCSLSAQDTGDIESDDIYTLSPFEISDNLGLPAVTLKKQADKLLLVLTLENDSREWSLREKEIKLTVERLIKAAEATEDFRILSDRKPIGMGDLDRLEIDAVVGKADTSTCELLLKTPLKPGEDAQDKIDRMEAFADQVEVEGRTIVESGAIGLSVEDPQQYRKQIIGMIAEDYKFILGTFDGNFQILVHGLNQRIQWERSSVSELDLYIDYEYEVLAPDTQSLKVKTVEEY